MEKVNDIGKRLQIHAVTTDKKIIKFIENMTKEVDKDGK